VEKWGSEGIRRGIAPGPHGAEEAGTLSRPDTLPVIQSTASKQPTHHKDQQHWQRRISANSRGGHDAWKLWSVWRNFHRHNVERHPRRVDAETVRSRLHAVQMIRAMLMGGGHVSAVNCDASPDHAHSLCNEHRQQNNT